ncbi:MAG TPA: hypothetical protein VH834_22935 [Solirubrobacteraceae bacterium]|jgi:hypothetical protein
MSADPGSLRVRPSGPQTLDGTGLVALDAVGTIVGRATLSRMYGARGELRLELAPTGIIALALIEATERAARERGLVALELDASVTGDRLVADLRRARATRDEHRGTDLHVTWTPTG